MSCRRVTSFYVYIYVSPSRHSLDALFGDDPGGGSVEDLLKPLQLEPVHPAGRHNTLITQHKNLLLSLPCLPVYHAPLHNSCASMLPAARLESNHIGACLQKLTFLSHTCQIPSILKKKHDIVFSSPEKLRKESPIRRLLHAGHNEHNLSAI